MIASAAYTPEGWHDFFLAIVGAAAALAGLVFVALSINLTRILSFPWLPGRAAETVGVLFEALVVSALCLVPEPRLALGLELVAVGVAGWSFPLVLQVRGRAEMTQQGRTEFFAGRVVATQIATIPVIVAGASLSAHAGGGFYWLVPRVGFLLLVGVVRFRS